MNSTARYVIHYGPEHAVFGHGRCSATTKAVAVREARRMARAYPQPAWVTRASDGATIARFQKRAPWEGT